MTLLEKCKEFEELMSQYRKFGATDTEPRFHFRNALYCKIHKEVDKVPKNADDWELYSSMEGSELAAEEMTKALKPIIESIDDASHKEVKEVISWYGIEE